MSYIFNITPLLVKCVLVYFFVDFFIIFFVVVHLLDSKEPGVAQQAEGCLGEERVKQELNVHN